MASQVPPHPQPSHEKHAEWVIDEAEDESFPASHPSSITQPRPRSRKPRAPKLGIVGAGAVGTV